MQYDHVLKKMYFDLLAPSPGQGGDCGSAGKIFATMSFHLGLPLI